jgi:hypothetical protein
MPLSPTVNGRPEGDITTRLTEGGCEQAGMLQISEKRCISDVHAHADSLHPRVKIGVHVPTLRVDLHKKHLALHQTTGQQAALAKGTPDTT